MATQEEVLDAFHEMGGYATVKRLKQYFGLPYKPGEGSSWIPQRLNALVRKGEILQTPANIYILNDFDINKEESEVEHGKNE